MPNTEKDFPNALREMRRIKDWSQKEAADYLNVSLRTYGSYESGFSIPARTRFEEVTTLIDEIVRKRKAK